MKYRCTRLVLAVAVVLPVTCGSVAAAPAAAPLTPDTGTAASDDDPGATLLPPLPTRLGEGSPCTGASDEKATKAAWSQTALGLSRAQRMTRGAGVTVAVVDSGVAPDVRSLSGRVTSLDGAEEDCLGHGTFAAGLIAAAPETGSGVTGVAPEAGILALPGTDDRGVPSVERVAAGIRTAADRGARVIYVGQVLRTGRSELTDAVAHATRRDALVVAPAAPDAVPREERGPDGEMPRGPYWPAAVPDVLAVVDFGPDGARQKDAPPAHGPDLAAPGGSMVGTGPQGTGHYIASGASLAAAGTAGAAALVRAYRPELSAREVSRQLIAAAYPSDTPRLDPYGALTFVPDGRAALEAESVPAQLPAPPDTTPHRRSLAIAAVGLTIVLLLAAAALIIPRGRSRGWRPPGVPTHDTSTGR